MKRSGQPGIAILLFLAGGALLYGTAHAGDCAYPSGFVKGSLSGFAAGPGEKTFRQLYAPRLTLPVDEQAFLVLLKERHLEVEIYAEGSDVPCRDSPWQGKVIDFRVARTYFIIGRERTATRPGIYFAAFVDAEGKVFYIENRFGYVGAQ